MARRAGEPLPARCVEGDRPGPGRLREEAGIREGGAREMSTELSPLPELARRINAEHAACLDAAQTAVGKAMEVGRLLVEAKGQVRHGEWARGVEENCTFGIRQAQNYMRAHQNRAAIEEEMRNGASHLASLRGAI